MVTVTVKLFARARELAGTSELRLDLPDGSDTSFLLKNLCQLFPPLEELLPCVVLARNHEYLSSPVLLQAGDEIALIPPISGG